MTLHDSLFLGDCTHSYLSLCDICRFTRDVTHHTCHGLFLTTNEEEEVPDHEYGTQRMNESRRIQALELLERALAN